MRRRASLTSAITYGAGVVIVRGLLDSAHRDSGHAGPFQAGDLRARSFLDLEPQHADRAVDGERPP